MSTTTPTTAWAVKRINYFHSGTCYPTTDDYIRDFHGRIIAVETRAEAIALAKAMEPCGTYYLAHGEYAAPDYEPRRVRRDSSRIRMMTIEQIGDLLDLDVGLEVAEI